MEKLKAQRINAGLSIKTVASTLGLARSTIWQYEAGKRKVSFDTLIALAKLYGCKVDDFID
jgi:transcriptional regulator with XRE-family HTH domain